MPGRAGNASSQERVGLRRAQQPIGGSAGAPTGVAGLSRTSPSKESDTDTWRGRSFDPNAMRKE
jgi:hypothetical protein